MHARHRHDRAGARRAGLLVERRGALPRQSRESPTTVAPRNRDRSSSPFAARERDGHDYLDARREAGAAAAIVEDPDAHDASGARRERWTSRGRGRGGRARTAFPRASCSSSASPGTNGKTTTVNMLRHLLDDPDGAQRVDRHARRADRQRRHAARRAAAASRRRARSSCSACLRALRRRAACARVAMEVSSHSLRPAPRRRRVVRRRGVHEPHARPSRLPRHDGGVLRREGEARSTICSPHGTVVFNARRPGVGGAARRRAGASRFSERVADAEVRADDVRFGPRGSEWTLALGPNERRRCGCRSSATSTSSTRSAPRPRRTRSGCAAQQIAERLSTLPQVPGRLEVLHERRPCCATTRTRRTRSSARSTPCARSRAERLIVVFGCGGDRDKGKRPEMGAHRRAKARISRSSRATIRAPKIPERILDDIEARHDAARTTSASRTAARRSRARSTIADAATTSSCSPGRDTRPIRCAARRSYPFDEKHDRERADRERDRLARAREHAAHAERARRSRRSGRSTASPTRSRRCAGESAARRSVFGRVWTDTRTIAAGDLLRRARRRALRRARLPRGRRREGRDGARRVATRRGAAASACRCSRCATRSSRSARSRRYRRRAWSRPVVGVVGTNGKTSTKELIKAALGSALEVHATHGNLNNLVGVPLTLLAIPDDADVAVDRDGHEPAGRSRRAARDRRAGHRRGHVDRRGASRGARRSRGRAARGAGGVRRRRRSPIVPAAQPEVVDGGAAARATRRRGGARRRRPARRRAGASTPMGAACSTFDGVDDRRAAARRAQPAQRDARARRRARARRARSSDAARGIAAMPAPPMRVERRSSIGAATLINDAYNSNPARRAPRSSCSSTRARGASASRCSARCSSSGAQAGGCTTTSRATALAVADRARRRRSASSPARSARVGAG